MGNLNFKNSKNKNKNRFIYPSTSHESIDEHYLKQQKKYAGNSIKTQKYNIFTFIPRNLYEQFHRFANIYFVFILILNFLPYIQAFGKEVAPIPVLFVLSVTAVKDIVEDFRRYKSDKRVNHTKCDVYNKYTKTFLPQYWKNIKAGDFVKLHANETIPADIVVLYSNDKSGICHIETANLDGETNLKQREVVSLQMNEKFDPENLNQSYLEVESPHKEIYKFNGTIHKNNSSDKLTMQKNNLLLRGCLLRNTEEVIGIVVYAGKDTKSMLNNNDHRFKRSKLERQINKDVIWCVLILIFLCLLCSIGQALWMSYNQLQDFVEYYKVPPDIPDVLKNPAMQGFLTFWRCVIYYQMMIPLPLYVTFEVVKMYQVYNIRNDSEMWDPDADTGVEVRAFNIPEDLGQVQYVFCDKTGTLTENRMEFRRAFIDGCDYIHLTDAEEKKDLINSNCDVPDKGENLPVNSNGIINKVTENGKFPDDESELKDEESLFEQKYLKDLIPILENNKQSDDDSIDSSCVVDFFLLMALCNTAVVSLNKYENKPIIKTKKSSDIRRKIKKNIQNAGEDLRKKAASLSNFTPRNMFHRSGTTSFATSSLSASEISSSRELPPTNSFLISDEGKQLELTGYVRRDSAFSPLKIVLEEDSNTDRSSHYEKSHNENSNNNRNLATSNSRKVKSVLDFRAKLTEKEFNMDDSDCAGTNNEFNRENDEDFDGLSCTMDKDAGLENFDSMEVRNSDFRTSSQNDMDYPDGSWSNNSSFYGDNFNRASYNNQQNSNHTSMTTMGISNQHNNNSRQHLNPSSFSRGFVSSFSTSDSDSCPLLESVLLDSYESESPDEMALVKTACVYGYKLLQRGQSFVTIWNPGQKQAINYQVLHLLPFDSVRKKMSIIVQQQNSNNAPIILYCKGADSTMLPRLSKSTDGPTIENTKDYVNEYARMGLRTLVLGKRILSTEEFTDWHKRYKAAEQMLCSNEEVLNKLMDEIEDELTLLGVTGIEDCLQEGVPDTIASLRKAGINIWVLTGDKQETAINIAYSARLFSEKHKIITISGDSKDCIRSTIQHHLLEIESRYPTEIAEIRQGHLRPLIRRDLALCIEGDALGIALQDQDLKLEFLRLAEQCSSVVCARSTPLQKADVVQLVKENLCMQTLAIGDGANDVSMIQTADVGIGIGGLEGMQAVMASDFSMTKFKHLKRLLLVHGSWCYNKLARTALYMFYKDALYILLMFWYQLHNAFSTSVMIDQITQILFNITMSGLPPLVYGMLDIDLKPRTLMNNPQLYRHGVNCKTYQPWHFWMNILDSFFQSFVIFYTCFLFYNMSDLGIWEFGQVVVGSALLTTFVHLAVETRFWNICHAVSLIISFVFAWFAFTIMYNVICNKVTCGLDNQQDFIMHNIKRASFWILMIVIPAVAVLPRLVVTALVNTVKPSLLNDALQREHYYGDSNAHLHFSDNYPTELISVKRRGTLFHSILGPRTSSAGFTNRNQLGAEYTAPTTTTPDPLSLSQTSRHLRHASSSSGIHSKPPLSQTPKHIRHSSVSSGVRSKLPPIKNIPASSNQVYRKKNSSPPSSPIKDNDSPAKSVGSNHENQSFLTTNLSANMQSNNTTNQTTDKTEL